MPDDEISFNTREGEVARRWFGGLPRKPRPDHEALVDLAGQVDAIANALAPTFEVQGARMRDATGGNNGVGLWARRVAVVLRRLARSERRLGAPVWSPYNEAPIAMRGLAGAEPQNEHSRTRCVLAVPLRRLASRSDRLGGAIAVARHSGLLDRLPRLARSASGIGHNRNCT